MFLILLCPMCRCLAAETQDQRVLETGARKIEAIAAL